MIEFRVLIRLMACAPPCLAARPAKRTSVMLGVSLMMIGFVAASTAHSVILHVYSGTWPTAEPIPRSLIPCGQPKFSSWPSAPASSARRTMSCHTSRSLLTISEEMTARSGNRRFTSAISRRLSSIGRSLISSMLLRPITRWPLRSSDP